MKGRKESYQGLGFFGNTAVASPLYRYSSCAFGRWELSLVSMRLTYIKPVFVVDEAQVGVSPKFFAI